MQSDTRASASGMSVTGARHKARLPVAAAIVALLTLAGVPGGTAMASRTAAPTTSTRATMSYVGLVGDVSCDEPSIPRADAGELVRLGLHAVASSAPAELLVTSVRGNAETTVKPTAVTLESDIEGAVPRSRELERQANAVRLTPLVHALTVSPSDHCGTDIVSAIRVLRDTAAGGTSGRVGGPMTVVVNSNGVEVEQVHWESWYLAHRQTDPQELVKQMLAQGLGQDLRGIQLVWIGLGRIRHHHANGSYEDGGVPNAEYRALQRFWNDYVTACGGAPIRFFPTVALLVGGGAR